MPHGKAHGERLNGLKKKVSNSQLKTMKKLAHTVKIKVCNGLHLHGTWMPKFSYKNLIAHLIKWRLQC